MATIHFCYDFESWSSDTGYEIVHDIVHSGNDACKITGSGTRTLVCGGQESWWSGVNPDVLVGSFYIYTTNIDILATNTALALFSAHSTTGGYPQFQIRINKTTHKLYWYGTGGTSGSSPDFAITNNAWHRVDFKIDVSTTTGKYDLQVNGIAAPQHTEVLSVSDYDFYQQGYGLDATTNGFILYLDDVVVSETSGDYPIGQHNCVALWPNADGTHNAGSQIADEDGYIINGTTRLAWRIWNTYTGGSGGYVMQYGEGNYYGEVQFEDTAVSNIISVVGQAGCSTNDFIDQPYAAAFVRRGSTNYEIWGLPTGTRVFSMHVLDVQRGISPPGGGWTTSDVNSLLFRFGYCDAHVDYFPLCYEALLHIVYTDSNIDPAITLLEYVPPNIIGFNTITSKHAYMATNSATGSSSKHAYTKGGVVATASKHAYMKGSAASTPAVKHAYIQGKAASSSLKHAYLRGGVIATSSKHAYEKGQASASGIKHAFMVGYLANSTSKQAYIRGKATAITSKHAYLNGVYRSVKHAYIQGGTNVTTFKHAYMEGLLAEGISYKHAYIAGATGFTRTSKHAYIPVAAITPASPTSSKHAFMEGAAGFSRTSKHAYMPVNAITPGSVSGSKHAYIEGAS